MDKRQLACHAVSVKKLNFGCGHRYAKGWVNIDFHSGHPAVQRVNLLQRLPFADGTFDVVYSSHVLEHFAPATAEALLRECHRVLKPGSTAVLRTPYWNSPDQFADLTHRHAFGHRSFDMFDPTTTLGRQRSYYTTTRFSVDRYLVFIRPFGVYIPIAGPRPLVRGILRLAERFGRIVWSQEHWLTKRR